MVFCFHSYHQKDWWRLTHSYDLGTKVKQKKSWLLVLIRVEKTVSQLSWPVFPSSVRALFFSHSISHTFSSEISLYVHSRAVLLDSWAHHTRLRKTSWSCEMLCHGLPADAVNIPSFSGCIPPTAQENMGNCSFPWRGDTCEQDPSWGKEPMCLSLLLSEGSGKQLPAGAWTRLQRRHPEASSTEGLDVLILVSVHEESRQLLFLVGSELFNGLLNGIKWAIPWSCLGQYHIKDTQFSLCVFNTHTSISSTGSHFK